MSDHNQTTLPILRVAELDRSTLQKLYDRLDALIDHREREDTSCLTYIDALQEQQIELMNLLEGHDV
jgi:hypothetical protein